MLYRFVVQVGLAVLALVPSLAAANPTYSVDTVNCSGLQSSSLADVLSLACTGDFSLSGGTLEADSKIVLSAGGALWLDNISITAPQVELFVGSSVFLGDGVRIVAGSTSAWGNTAIPDVFVSPGATISIGNGTIPAPINLGIGSISANGVSLPGGGLGTISLTVPEPGGFAMLMAGLLALGGLLGARGRRSWR